MINVSASTNINFDEFKEKLIMHFGNSVEVSLQGQNISINIQDNDINRNKIESILKGDNEKKENLNQESEKQNEVDKVFDGIFNAQKPLFDKQYKEPLEKLVEKKINGVLSEIEKKIKEIKDFYDEEILGLNEAINILEENNKKHKIKLVKFCNDLKDGIKELSNNEEN